MTAGESARGAPADRTPSEPVTGGTPDAGGARTDARDPILALPVVALSVVLGTVTAGAIALPPVLGSGLGNGLAWKPESIVAAQVGGLVGAVSCAAGLLAIQPWKRRAASMWSLLWLAATTIRLLFTPAALLSLYCLTFLPGLPLFLGGVAAHLAVLAGETVVIARAVLTRATFATKSGGRKSGGPPSTS